MNSGKKNTSKLYSAVNSRALIAHCATEVTSSAYRLTTSICIALGYCWDYLIKDLVLVDASWPNPLKIGLDTRVKSDSCFIIILIWMHTNCCIDWISVSG